jgi:hypothetical protein
MRRILQMNPPDKDYVDLPLWRISAIFIFVCFIGEFVFIGVLSSQKQDIQHQLNELKIQYYRCIKENSTDDK